MQKKRRTAARNYSLMLKTLTGFDSSEDDDNEDFDEK